MFKPVVKLLILGTIISVYGVSVSAAMSRNDAWTLCLESATSAYGDNALITMKKYKARNGIVLELFVTRPGNARFIATCVVDEAGEVASVTPSVQALRD